MTFIIIIFFLVIIFLLFWTGRNAIKERREMKYPSATRKYHKDNEALLTGSHERKLMRMDGARVVEMDESEHPIS